MVTADAAADAAAAAVGRYCSGAGRAAAGGTVEAAYWQATGAGTNNQCSVEMMRKVTWDMTAPQRVIDTERAMLDSAIDAVALRGECRYP